MTAKTNKPHRSHTGAKTRRARPRRSNGAHAAKQRFTARTADKHVLYQLSVQDAAVEVDFIDRVFRQLARRAPRTLLEDFCGSALICGEWVSRGPARRATGVDIDSRVLAWGKRHNLSGLGEAAERITLLSQDVRDAVPAKFDAVCAMNFSYWVFTTRDEMRGYFQNVRRHLGREGVFVLDAYGGWESHEPMQERRRIKGGFTYVWDQNKFDPITHRIENHIHFEFADGSKLRRAFSYFWRFWSLPELRELLGEAGFSEVRVYWDHAEDDNDAEDFRPTLRAGNQPGWLAYLVARR